MGAIFAFLVPTWRYTPLPLIYWNHRISAKMATDLIGSLSCGQNLDVKELSGWFVETGWLVPTVTASTMIADLTCGRKVRCHRQAVKKILILRVRLTDYWFPVVL